MAIKDDLMLSMREEASAVTDYKRRAASARSEGDEVSAKLWEHIAEEEDGHYNEFKDRLSSIGYPIPEYVPFKEIVEKSPSGVYVTVTDTGDTRFRVGKIISAEAFDVENDTMRSLGKRPALGEYHY